MSIGHSFTASCDLHLHMAFTVPWPCSRLGCTTPRSRVPTTCSLNNTQISRRAVLSLLCGAAVSGLLRIDRVEAGDELIAANTTNRRRNEESPSTGYITRTGLKYVDFEEGKGLQPKWGDYVRIHYVAYSISPDGSSLQKEDSTYGRYGNQGYLIHHGNGEMILGLEEAIHSMRVGGRRRAIIPPKLAYIDFDLGPIPPSTRARRRFAEHIAQTDGTVVYDLELLDSKPDIDNRGYYDDLQPTDEEMKQMSREASDWYAEQVRAKGLEPPDPNKPFSEYQLGDPQVLDSSYAAPAIERPNLPGYLRNR